MKQGPRLFDFAVASLLRSHTAIYHDSASNHERRIVRGQKHGHASNLDWLSVGRPVPRYGSRDTPRRRGVGPGGWACRELGIGRWALRHALRMLREEGVVETIPGRGTFVRDARPRPGEEE